MEGFLVDNFYLFFAKLFSIALFDPFALVDNLVDKWWISGG
jgi:hypothetical protein